MTWCRRPTRASRFAAAGALVFAVSAAACGSESGTSSSTSAGSTSSASTSTSTSTAMSSIAVTTTGEPEPTAPLWGPPGAGSLPPATTAALQAAIDDWVEQGSLTGMTAAVVMPAGTWSGAAGADAVGVALRPDAVLSLQSISKTYTAAEVMLLSWRDLVDLDAPLTDYVEVPFDTGGATVRQVLGMRSGFPSMTSEQSQLAMAADLDREWTLDAVLATLPPDAERLGTLGGAPAYNDLNYQVLAQLVANVTGSSFAAAVRNDLLEPSGLVHTWLQTGEVPGAPLTVGGRALYADIVDPDGPFMPSTAFASMAAGAGSVAADAADVARWGFLLAGGRAIDSTLVAEMEADPQPDPDVGLYGLGVMVGDDGSGTMMVGHAGGGTEWAYTTVLQVFAGDTPISIAVLVPEPADFFEQIFDVFMQIYSIVAA